MQTKQTAVTGARNAERGYTPDTYQTPAEVEAAYRSEGRHAEADAYAGKTGEGDAPRNWVNTDQTGKVLTSPQTLRDAILWQRSPLTKGMYGETRVVNTTTGEHKIWLEAAAPTHEQIGNERLPNTTRRSREREISRRL